MPWPPLSPGYLSHAWDRFKMNIQHLRRDGCKGAVRVWAHIMFKKEGVVILMKLTYCKLHITLTFL